MQKSKRHLIYYWTYHEVEDYNEVYGEDAFSEDLDCPGLCQTLMQYGTFIGEFNDLEEVNNIIDNSEYSINLNSWGNEMHYFDTKENIWWN